MTDYISRIFDMVLRALIFLRANPLDTPAFITNLARLESDAARLQELAAVIGKKEGRRISWTD